jgi:hypothetical protein
MRGNLAKLLALASAGLGPALGERPGLLGGKRADELWALLGACNGFYAFEGALHVFPSGGPGAQTLERWNAPDLWRGRYRELDDSVCFAEDVFGGQFILRGEAVHTFDPETGEIQVIADSLEGWAGALLEDYEFLTGQPLAHAWQAQHGALAAGHRLVPKVPFVVGGAFELANLHAMEAVHGMTWRADLARQLRDLPDGTAIQFKVVE